MGIDDSGAVTSLVGLDGFVVRAQVHDGEQWWLAVEIAAGVVGCELCGARAVGHGRRRVKVRDLPVCGEPVTLVWAKRIWRCPDGDCVVKTLSEGSGEIAGRAVLTERARADIARRVGLVRNRSLGWLVALGCRGPRPWTRCAITAGPGLIICPGWVPRRPLVWTRHRFSELLASTRRCW